MCVLGESTLMELLIYPESMNVFVSVAKKQAAMWCNYVIQQVVGVRVFVSKLQAHAVCVQGSKHAGTIFIWKRVRWHVFVGV